MHREGRNIGIFIGLGYGIFHAIAEDKAYRLAAFLTAPNAPSVHDYDIRNETMLFLACTYGSAACASLLIAEGADVNHRASFSARPLHRAARLGHADLVPLLIGAGADVNEGMGRRGAASTPLVLACLNGQVDTVRELLAHGAKPDYGFDIFEQRSPLEIAREKQNPVLVAMLEKAIDEYKGQPEPTKNPS